jgi:uncharacterized protein YbjT (DUF2867 family)
LPHVLRQLLAGKLALAMSPERKLKQIAVADIGALVASLIERGASVFGRRLDIAGDDVSGTEAAAILSKASGVQIRFEQVPMAAVRQQSEDFARMFEWFERVGYAAYIAGLRREFPEVRWHRLADGAAGVDWARLKKPAAAATA